MKLIEKMLRTVMALSILGMCVGVATAIPAPAQPPGCDQTCRHIYDYHDCTVYGQWTYEDCLMCSGNAVNLMCKSPPGAGSCKDTDQQQWVKRAIKGTPVCACTATITWVEATKLSEWTDPAPVNANRKQKTCK